MADRKDPESVVRGFIARINAQDPAGIVSLCGLDHVLTDSLGNQVSGRTRLAEGWRGYFALFPDYRIEIQEIAAIGDVVLACGIAAGTYAATGVAWRIPAAWRAKVIDGQLAEWQVYADNKPVYEILSTRA